MSTTNLKYVPPKPFDPKDLSKVTLSLFTPARVAMLKESDNHPVLVDQLAELEEGGQAKDSHWGDWVAEIAAYCNVAMDGLYSEEDLEILYPQMLKRMVDTRLSYNAGIILAH